MKEKNLILDVDGTLWDTTEIVAQAWNRAIEEAGGCEVRVTAEMLKQLFGRTMKAIADILFVDMEEGKKYELLERCCEAEQEALEQNECNILYPKVKETIIGLAKDHCIFIVSNCHAGYIELFLRKTNLESFVTDIECYGNNGNSKGENIKLLMQRNQIKQAVYVGDTQGDYEAAGFAGIPFAYAAYGFGKPQDFDFVIQSFHELSDLF